MKTLTLIAISLILFQACQSESQDTPYTDFSIYLTKDSMVKSVLDINSVVIDSLLFKYEDMVSYDSLKHRLELKSRTDTLFYNHGLDGRGFIAVLDGDIKVYCGIFFSPVHSSTNPNITITLPMDNATTNHSLEILENYHDSSVNKGYAKINDKRIIDLFKKDNKLK